MNELEQDTATEETALNPDGEVGLEQVAKQITQQEGGNSAIVAGAIGDVDQLAEAGDVNGLRARLEVTLRKEEQSSNPADAAVFQRERDYIESALARLGDKDYLRQRTKNLDFAGASNETAIRTAELKREEEEKSGAANVDQPSIAA